MNYSLKMEKLQKAIFLDRDGLINDNSIAYYIHRDEDFKLNPGVIECLKAFSKHGYILIVITNQGGIAKQVYGHDRVKALNELLKETFIKEGVQITDIFYCPHHSSISKCLCRKPDSLLFEKAMAKYHIDPKLSYMIGDSERDVIASEKAGIQGIRVPSNQNLYEELKQSVISYLL
jgi:D-glycero-D-manno-heptose 1,7-bisphosphate phosphatase